MMTSPLPKITLNAVKHWLENKFQKDYPHREFEGAARILFDLGIGRKDSFDMLFDAKKLLVILSSLSSEVLNQPVDSVQVPTERQNQFLALPEITANAVSRFLALLIFIKDHDPINVDWAVIELHSKLYEIKNYLKSRKFILKTQQEEMLQLEQFIQDTNQQPEQVNAGKLRLKALNNEKKILFRQINDYEKLIGNLQSKLHQINNTDP